MTRRAWVRLDNASNIFLAARTSSDPKVFRFSAETDHEVDPRLLQAALDQTYDRYPLYHAVLRRGVFWYYLQDSDLRPVVTAETEYPCAPLYRVDRRNLLFRVVHHGRRISLEVFHALSDGTGALWFLADLVTAYLGLRYPDRAGDGSGIRVETGLTPDSFRQYFRDGRPSGDAAGASSPGASSLRRLLRPPRRSVHRIRGTHTPDGRPRVVELTMPVSEVLGAARAEGVSVTMYLTALFFESVRRTAGDLGARPTLAASVPVNLRQFFPSTSARNFFATVRVEHTYGAAGGADGGADDVGSVARALEAQFRPQATPEALERKLQRFIRFERAPLLRVVPRPLKDLLLRLVNRGNNRGLSVAVSNMGRVTLPQPAEALVGRVLFHVSAVRPQFCAVSHAGRITVSFSSPFTQTDHIREFARMIADRGCAVTVAAARVTEAELAAAGPDRAGPGRGDA